MPRFSICTIIRLVLISAITLVTACGGGSGDETSSSVARSSQSNIAISSSQSTSSLSSSSTPSSRSSSLNSRSSSSSSSAGVSVAIEWSHPTERENGAYLELSEIGGYEIRVYDSRTAKFTYYDIKGNSTTRYSLSGYNTGMNIEIAVYDTTGLYSEYVSVTN